MGMKKPLKNSFIHWNTDRNFLGKLLEVGCIEIKNLGISFHHIFLKVCVRGDEMIKKNEISKVLLDLEYRLRTNIKHFFKT